MRRVFLIFVALFTVYSVISFLFFPPGLWVSALLLPVVALGIYDITQRQHAILRTFPVVGHGRYLLERIRPEINQYFVESDVDGRPFHREHRSIVYKRAKRQVQTVPFGTKHDVYRPGYEWVNHSLVPSSVDPSSLRITIGGPHCRQPYSASIFNISAMSFGALSSAAIEALNGGASRGGFAHNTGEGGVSPYHLAGRGDLIWQIGTGYFGCRTEQGAFCPTRFERTAQLDAVKMIEVKLSQGAKPGHGGVLPGSKVTSELAEIRGVPAGQTVISPPAHASFSTPVGLLEYVAQLRDLCGGKPVGFKLCVGKRREFFAITKAMIKTSIVPDFITIDGAEGGTGAAPLEFCNAIGTPLLEGLSFVHNALVGAGLRDQVKLLCSGRIITGFHLVKRIALGADACYSARGMMFALGCIQALRCNENSCPAGVATQRGELVVGLHVPTKVDRVFGYHEQTLHAVAEFLGAMGLTRTDELRPWHVHRRISAHETRHYGELYDYVQPGAFVNAPVPAPYARAWHAASADTFAAQPSD
ncbi:MAG: FMN-binding glutamate synthase family protein [Nannocystaceae bacterium]